MYGFFKNQQRVTSFGLFKTRSYNWLNFVCVPPFITTCFMIWRYPYFDGPFKNYGNSSLVLVYALCPLCCSRNQPIVLIPVDSISQISLSPKNQSEFKECNYSCKIIRKYFGPNAPPPPPHWLNCKLVSSNSDHCT